MTKENPILESSIELLNGDWAITADVEARQLRKLISAMRVEMEKMEYLAGEELRVVVESRDAWRSLAKRRAADCVELRTLVQRLMFGGSDDES